MLEEAEVIAGCVVETVNRHRASTYRQLAVLDDPLNSGIAGAERVLTEAGGGESAAPLGCARTRRLSYLARKQSISRFGSLKAACTLPSRVGAAPFRVIALWSSERVGSF